MPRLVLDDPFVAGRPCVKLTAGGPFLASPIELVCAVDTGNRYQLFLTGHSRQRLGLDSALFWPSGVLLMNGTTKFPGGLLTTLLTVTWAGRRRPNLPAHFAIVGSIRPSAIDAYVGADFFTDEILEIDHARGRVRVSVP